MQSFLGALFCGLTAVASSPDKSSCPTPTTKDNTKCANYCSVLGSERAGCGAGLALPGTTRATLTHLWGESIHEEPFSPRDPPAAVGARRLVHPRRPHTVSCWLLSSATSPCTKPQIGPLRFVVAGLRCTHSFSQLAFIQYLGPTILYFLWNSLI